AAGGDRAGRGDGARERLLPGGGGQRAGRPAGRADRLAAARGASGQPGLREGARGGGGGGGAPRGGPGARAGAPAGAVAAAGGGGGRWGCASDRAGATGSEWGRGWRRWAMKSPFPGMDPYIEACGFWEDFHNGLIESIAIALAAKLPANYVARTGVRAYVVLA